MATKQVMQDVLPDINTRYAYVLSKKNEKRGKVYDGNGNPRNSKEYKPYLNVLLKSSVVWPGGKDPFSGKERPAGRYMIRYYDGCTTLFIDDQPREKDAIDALVHATREMIFANGYCFVYGYDTNLKLYMDWCSFNEDSPFRVPSVEIKFKNVNTEKNLLKEGALLELEDEARELAKGAPVKKMKSHCKYLGISVVDAVTSQPLSDEAVRIEYRKSAKANPKRFRDSYNDKTLEIKTWVTEAIVIGQISTTITPNKAVWSKSQSVICDVSGLKQTEMIIEKLVEYTQTEESGDFLSQLKSLYS